MVTLLKSTATLLLLALAASAGAADINIAVASNFTAAAKELANDFQQRHGHSLRLSFGSTGKLYTQIYNGAPFDVFLAADAERPERAETEGLAVAQTRFTYALGKVALWSSDGSAGEALRQRLQSGDYRRIALANPKTAPYGMAAKQVIGQLTADQAVGKMVFGENIAQTHQFVSTGNADLGMVALAQMTNNSPANYWVVPEHFYTPIRQQAVLLQQGQESPEAQTFLAYLRQPEAQLIIQKYGYGIE